MKPGKFHATVAASTETSAGPGRGGTAYTDPGGGFCLADAGCRLDRAPANGFFIVKEGWDTTWCSRSAPLRGGDVGVAGKTQPGLADLRA